MTPRTVQAQTKSPDVYKAAPRRRTAEAGISEFELLGRALTRFGVLNLTAPKLIRSRYLLTSR